MRHLTFGEVVKEVGSIAEIVRLLGYPVNRYTVERWRRAKQWPEKYKHRIAEHIGVAPEALDRDPGGYIVRTPYLKMAVLYKTMVAAAGVNTRSLPRLHKVGKQRVEDWRTGVTEAPIEAFADLYYFVKSRTDKMTMDLAMERTGLTQTQIVHKLGVSAGMGTYWRKRGEIPPAYADRIRAWLK